MKRRALAAVVVMVMGTAAGLAGYRRAAAAGSGTEVGGMTGNVKWLGHASFRIEAEKIIYIDPWKTKGGPKADLILITHDHRDHCSPEDVKALSGKDTVVVTVSACAAKLGREVTLIAPGQTLTVKGIRIEAVPAYNLDKKFHPRAAGYVGYIVEAGGKRIYHAGDTDFIPEMKNLRVDVALLPVGGTYTMTAAEAGEAARAINPKVAVPMHFGDIVGGKEDGALFRDRAGIPVEVLQPEP